MKSKISYLLLVLILLTSLILTGVSCKTVKVPEPLYWPRDGWQTAAPESVGIDSEKLAEGLNEISDNGTHIHSLMIIRNDSIVLDSYFYPYNGSTYHDVASVTKSIMTTLIAIAADQGKLSLDAPILSFFSDRIISNMDSKKQQVTVRHLVSNSSGFLFDEKDDQATIQAMINSDDWIQATLDLSVVHEPVL